ncbi:MAG: porin family protein [Cytophagaceae bacterium]
MKKLYITFMMALLCWNANAQVKIGIRVSPAFCINRIDDKDDTDAYNFKANGSKMRFSIGPSFDFKLSDNIDFSTGLWYMSYRNGLKATNVLVDYKESVSLQSVQVPVTFKVTTNEIMTNLKIYVQFGGQANFFFYEKYRESTPNNPDYENKYTFMDAAIYAGAGVNYLIGETNEIYGGLYYNRGLVNLIQNNDAFKYKDGIKYNTDLIGLEVGVRF